MTFYALQVSFERMCFAFTQKPDNKELAFALVEELWEHLETREILCLHRPKTLNASDFQRYIILDEWIQCLFSNPVDRLFVATSQSANDPRLQILRLDTNQLAAFRDPTEHSACLLASHHGEM